MAQLVMVEETTLINLTNVTMVTLSPGKDGTPWRSILLTMVHDHFARLVRMLFDFGLGSRSGAISDASKTERM